MPDLTKLTPVSINVSRGRPSLTLCRLGPIAFTEPFFDETISSRLLRLEAADTLEIDLERSGPRLAELPALKPTGFIFQMSRCGSTLVSRMLASIPENLVISEARVLNSLLDPRLDGDLHEKRLSWLRWVVQALGQRLRGVEQRFFIKFTSWNVLQLAVVRQAFPGVPWVFLHRDGLEVLASVLKKLPGYMTAGAMGEQFAKYLKLEPLEVSILSKEEFAGRLLGAFCQAAVDQLADFGIAVDYRELPAAVTTRITSHYGWPVSAEEASCMHEVSKFYSKDGSGSQVFQDDSREKQELADPKLRAIAQQWIAPIRVRLL